MNCHATSRLLCLAVIFVALSAISTSGQEADDTTASKARWTLSTAIEHLEMYPNDSFLQYVTMQLARRENLEREYAGRIREIITRGRRDWQRRNEQVNLFSLFAGTLAIQESLQLEVMAGAPVNPRDSGDGLVRPEELNQLIDVSTLQGPSTQSHPWEEMLAGQQPKIDSFAAYIPDDQYYIRFKSIAKLLDVLSLNETWGDHLLSQASRKAYTSQVNERLMKQLALETNELVAPFYDLVVSEMVATGNDLYLTRGSDVTLLFKYQQKALFDAQMKTFYANALRSNADAVEGQGAYKDVEYVSLTTPDRRLHVFIADLGDNIHVRSNSVIGLQRIIDTIQDGESDDMMSLAESKEFAYIRTLMPLDSKEEDGFIYLSDPFIRRLTGPELKLTEMRRVICYNHLQMLSHAAALYESEHGHAATSLEELIDADCLPASFGTDKLRCPDGGVYSLDPETHVGICSHHGQVGLLKPCCEVAAARVTAAEAEQYKQFVASYEQYWRTFFDPIAIRLTVQPERLQMETIILPLINNSIYQGMAASLGGDPTPLEHGPLPERNIFSMAFQLDKQGLLQRSGLVSIEQIAKNNPAQEILIEASVSRLRQIGVAFHNYHDTHKSFPARASTDENGKELLSWRVHLLPFIGQQELYEKFRLDEPWSSPHNRQFIGEIPEVYSIPGEPDHEGRTAFLGIVSRNTMFNTRNIGTGIREVTDGTSNTVLVAEVNRKEAVIWTQPDDVNWPPSNLRDKLLGRYGEMSLVLMTDGTVRSVGTDVTDENLKRAVIKNDGQPLQDFGRVYQIRRRNEPFVPWLSNLRSSEIDQDLAYQFVTKGIKDQFSMHVYDSEPTFDFQLTRFLGQILGSFSARNRLDNDFIPLFMLVASLNSPVYASIPLDDVHVTDQFLEHLDKVIAPIARRQRENGWFRVENDFYTIPITDDVTARTESVSIGPVKWRFFWARIGKQLYVASKPEVLQDLARLEADGQGQSDPETAAHAMVRIRPDHWKQTLNNFQLGWAESHRLACLDNVGRISSLSDIANGDVQARPENLYGLNFFCPCGGHYEKDEAGHVHCSIHGTAYQPHQGAIGDDRGSIQQVLNNFGGMTIKLTFLEDGLHATISVDRKPADKIQVKR